MLIIFKTKKNLSMSFLFYSISNKIFLLDEHPFEHEFLIRIAQAFPFINILSFTNMKPQQYK